MSPKQYDLLQAAREQFPVSTHVFLWGTFSNGVASLDVHEWTWLKDDAYDNGVKFEVFIDLQGNRIQANK